MEWFLMRKGIEKLLSAGRLAREVSKRCASQLSARPRPPYVGWLGYENPDGEAMFQANRRLMRSARLFPIHLSKRQEVLQRSNLSGRKFFRAAGPGGGTLVNPGFWPLARAPANEEVLLVMLGTGVGSAGFGQPPEVLIAVWSDLASHIRAVVVRGRRFQCRLQAVGFTNVKVIGDPALSLALDTLPPFRQPARLVVNLADRPERGLIIELGRFFAEFAGRGGTLVGAALSPDDIRAFDRLFALKVAPHFPLLLVPRDPAKHIRLISGARALLAVRLHAAVPACCAGILPLLFFFRLKCEAFMAPMELTDYPLPWNPHWAAKLRQLWQRMGSEKEALRVRILDRPTASRSVQARFAQRAHHQLLCDAGVAAPSLSARR